MIRIRSTALMTLALLATSQGAAEEARLGRKVLAMGTMLGLELSGPSRADLEAASEKAVAEVERIEAALSTWRQNSEFSRLNLTRGVWVSLGEEWVALLTTVQQQALRTEGAFDPMLGPLVQVWGLRGGGRTPSAKELREARAASGLRHLQLDPSVGAVKLLHPAAGLEEGGFGKGHALDRAAHVLQANGAQSGLLDFGGQLLAFGAERTVSLADPRDRMRPRVSVRLGQASLAATGTSERGAHILNPKTGRPCRRWGSVAVIAPSGLEADCLSTALYVMGPRKGLAWATAHHLTACFLLNNGQIRMSPAFRALAPSLL